MGWTRRFARESVTRLSDMQCINKEMYAGYAATTVSGD